MKSLAGALTDGKVEVLQITPCAKQYLRLHHIQDKHCKTKLRLLNSNYKINPQVTVISGAQQQAVGS